MTDSYLIHNKHQEHEKVHVCNRVLRSWWWVWSFSSKRKAGNYGDFRGNFLPPKWAVLDKLSSCILTLLIFVLLVGVVPCKIVAKRRKRDSRTLEKRHSAANTLRASLELIFSQFSFKVGVLPSHRHQRDSSYRFPSLSKQHDWRKSQGRLSASHFCGFISFSSSQASVRSFPLNPTV